MCWGVWETMNEFTMNSQIKDTKKESLHVKEKKKSDQIMYNNVIHKLRQIHGRKIIVGNDQSTV